MRGICLNAVPENIGIKLGTNITQPFHDKILLMSLSQDACFSIIILMIDLKEFGLKTTPESRYHYKVAKSWFTNAKKLI